TSVHRHRSRRALEETKARRQECRFTEPGWCGDERQLRLRSAVQALAQSRARDQTAAHLGEVDLGLEQQAGHDQSRNAPTVFLKPWTKYRCRTANTTSGVIVVRPRMLPHEVERSVHRCHELPSCAAFLAGPQDLRARR